MMRKEIINLIIGLILFAELLLFQPLPGWLIVLDIVFGLGNIMVWFFATYGKNIRKIK